MLRLHPFAYHRPDTLEAATSLLREHDGDVMPIAGGTDLMPNMKHRLFTPGHVVSLRAVPELRGIHVRDGELWIGSGETLSTVAADAQVQRHAPSLARAAGLVAGPQLRNMGTIGGNICLDTRCTYYNQSYFWREALGFCLKKDGHTCHVTRVGRKCVAAHSADSPPVLITLGATVDLVSADGERSIPVSELFLADGIWNSVRRPDEVLVRVRVPLPSAGLLTAFEKVRQRNSIDFPLLNVAVACRIDESRLIGSISIVVSALGSRPRVVSGLERIAEGNRLDDDVIDAVAERAWQQCHPLTNITVDADWRRAMVPVHVRRALLGLVRAEPLAA
jgi:4-hydroxybenzoyl-CoA reductase subunit beta